ncbi:PREDICTED: uncharacterized protein LOC109481823 [Branchiostoma belcheri]|uniref:Uncharacterized protein LOC109481823 n=1 Tax=Branchiostoma belcheri TaxID=7741 RepID=A0A6P5A0Y4_BRABE|nr:PREDICTED: uncharacterized protein LOC109481823 [Branchiostoma belcheri]XP_019639989.1 PREDICTED: uncharacterized protein LOC109481823 [Branchiostoma belcheri]
MASGGSHSIHVNCRNEIKEEPITISRLTLSEENQVGDAAESKVANIDSFKFRDLQTSTKLVHGDNADSDMLYENNGSQGSESKDEDKHDFPGCQKEALATKIQNGSSFGLQSGNPTREGNKTALCSMENRTSDTDSCTSPKEVINQTEKDHGDVTDTDQIADGTPMAPHGNVERQEDTRDNGDLQKTPCSQLAVDLFQDGSGGSKTYQGQLIVKHPSTHAFHIKDGGTIQIDEACKVIVQEKMKVKNSSGVQLGRDNIVLRRQTSNNTGDTDALSTAASESPIHSSNKEKQFSGSTIRVGEADTIHVYREFEFENCHGMQFGDDNVTKMVDPEDSTESNPDLVNVCLDLDIDDRDEDDMFKKLGNEDCRREFCRRLASRGGANCELEEATRGCILLKMKVPTEQDRLRLIQMAKDGTFKDIFLETFLPDYAKRGKNVRVNLAIAVTNPSQAIVDEMKAPSNGHKDVVIVEVGGHPSTPGILRTVSASPLSASPEEIDDQGASQSGENMDSHKDPDEHLQEEEDYLQVLVDGPRVTPVGAEAAEDVGAFREKPLPPTPTSKMASPSKGWYGQEGPARPPVPLLKEGTRSPKKALVSAYMKGVSTLPPHHTESKGKVPSPPWKELKGPGVKKASEPIDVTSPGRTSGRMVWQRKTGEGNARDAKNEKKERSGMARALGAEMTQKFGGNWQAAAAVCRGNWQTAKPRTPDKPVPAVKPGFHPKPGLTPKPGASPKPGLARKPGHPSRQGMKPLVRPRKPQVKVQEIMEEIYEYEEDEEVSVNNQGIRRTPPEGSSFSKNLNEDPESEIDDVMPAVVSEDVDVEKAESCLRSSQVNGKYFLRPSKQDKGKMVLVVYDRAGQKYRKFKMYGLGYQLYLHKGAPTFLSMSDLLRHYQYHNLPVKDGVEIRLTEPYQGH